MSKQTSRLIVVLLVVGGIIALRMSPAGQVLTFENLKREQAGLLLWVEQHAFLSVTAFILLYIGVTALSIPGATILTMAGASIFGVLPTVLYVNGAATAGAFLAFLAARHLLGSWIQSKYGSQLASFNTEVRKNGARYLLGLRLLPVFPFFLINLLAGITTISPATFLWTTAVGIVPGTLLYAFAGSELSRLGSPADILTFRTAIALGALALIVVLPAVLHRVRAARGRGGR